MKTANVKVRVKDVRQGVTLYTAHPLYGIEKCIVLGKPFVEHHTKSLFVNIKSYLDDGFEYTTAVSLRDKGITPGDSYNGRRTFFKLKQAQAWMKKWSTDLNFKQKHANHEAWCDFSLLDDMYF